MGSKGICSGKSRNAGAITDRKNGPLVPNDVPKTLLHLQQRHNTRRYIRSLHRQQRHSGKDAL
eukprot:14661492-Ditylum_brightwellii.AAC.1